jgi:PKD repeat protein
MNYLLTVLFRVSFAATFFLVLSGKMNAQNCASFEVLETPNGYALVPVTPALSQFGGDPYWTITLQNQEPYIVEGSEILIYLPTLEMIGTQGAEICFTWGEANSECPFSFCENYVFNPDFGLQVSGGSTACNADFSYTTGENGLVEFINISSANAGPVEYTWTFGDESPAQSGAFASHTYTTSGTYTVCLEMNVYAGNDIVCTNVFCQDVTVELPETPCEPGLFPFSVDITTCCEVVNSNYAVFSITGTDNDFSLFGEIPVGNQPGIYSENVCIPAGCFEIQFDYGLMNQMAEQTTSIEYGSPNMTDLVVVDLFENLPWNSTFCISEVILPCPSAIIAESVDCNTFIFELDNPGEGVALWNFGDNSASAFGLVADHTYAEDGVYIVTVDYASNECQEGYTLFYTVLVNCSGNNCPETITAQPTNNCGEYLFFVPGVGPNAQVVWYPGDGSEPFTTSGEYIHGYEQPGSYQVCAMVYSPDCPQGNEICIDVIAEECNNNGCPTFINSENIDCNTVVFNINDDNVGYALWNFDDGVENYFYQGNPQHTFEENGVYVVSAQYFGPECQEGILLMYTVVINCQDELCPDAITITPGELCHQYVFEVNNWGDSPFGDILWDFGDNEGYGQNEFLHMYLEPGNYEVCVEGTTDQCPGGFNICTALNVEACGGDLNGDGCPDEIWAYPVNDCGLWLFEAGQFDAPEQSIVWNWGDGTTSEGNTIMEHQYNQDGIYIVTLTYSSAQCSETSVIATIEANACETPDCPQEIWSGPGDACGVVLFEAGGFVEGEEFVWYFGDGSVAEGGHFITHTYAEPGTYQVCCVLSNINCPGYQLCTVITVEDCNPTCTDIIIGLDSEVNNGGTPAVYYSLTNAEGLLITSGYAEYTEADPFFDVMTCLEDGCYYLTVDNNNPITIGEGFYVFINDGNNNLMENAEIVNQDNVSFTILFGVNSDCSEGSECEAAFEAIYTASPGHIEFINNSVYSGNASFLWSYGNGETSDGQFGNVWYDENGTYEVCLTVTTDNCTDTYCAQVIIEDIAEQCTDNTVVITATGSFNSNTTELIEIALADEDVTIETWTLPYNNQMITVTYEMCLADGCYTLSLSSDTPIMTEGINVVVTSNNTVIGEYELEGNVTSDNLVFGLNTDCTINVAEQSDETFIATYPVPANEFITIQIGDTGKSTGQIDLIDLNGKIIATQLTTGSRVTIPTAQHASGMYFIRVTTGDQVINKKILIAH